MQQQQHYDSQQPPQQQYDPQQQQQQYDPQQQQQQQQQQYYYQQQPQIMTMMPPAKRWALPSKAKALEYGGYFFIVVSVIISAYSLFMMLTTPSNWLHPVMFFSAFVGFFIGTILIQTSKNDNNTSLQ